MTRGMCSSASSGGRLVLTPLLLVNQHIPLLILKYNRQCVLES